jgi:metal transporter CNNM
MSHVQEEQVLTWYEYITYSGISLSLVCMGGLMSGLTLGLLSLDQVSIKILKKTGTDAEKKYARRLLPILKHYHWLLVTLLLWNAAAMEALPIFLDKIVPDYLAIILSVTCVLIFGEVIPQAAISRFGLAVGVLSLGQLVNCWTSF